MSLRWRLLLLLLAMPVLAWLLHAGLSVWPLPGLLALLQRHFGWNLTAPGAGSPAALALSLALLLPLALGLARWWLSPLTRLLRALEGLVLSYRDGDFSMTVATPAAGQHDELAVLARQHSELGLALRAQRQQLAQRELLLDQVVQNTPLALLLCEEPQGRIVYANLQARQQLARGRSLVGQSLPPLLEQLPAALAQALRSGQDQLFSVPAGSIEGLSGAEGAGSATEDESFHLSQRSLSLQGQPHRLILLRRITRELSRQEVASWKRVIRVISHELNNSLAPISSLAHSGAELLRRGDAVRAGTVFASISQRAAHLHQFLSGYAQFAKLPAPQPAPQDWAALLEGLGRHCRFRLEGALPQQPGRFDAAQIEQALINLLKNAAEAGGPAEAVSLSISCQGEDWWLCVDDRGPGMSEAVLAQALLPFYSTKRSGTGLGLALAREIAEAHGGRISLGNRSGGGLRVCLILPRRA